MIATLLAMAAAVAALIFSLARYEPQARSGKKSKRRGPIAYLIALLLAMYAYVAVSDDADRDQVERITQHKRGKA